MRTPRFPIENALTPEPTAALPDGFTLIDEPLLRGLPHRIPLEGELELALIVPSGEANLWRDAPPDLLLSVSDWQRAAAEELPDPRAPGLDRVPARLLLRRRRRVVAVLPLTAGLQQLVDVSGDGRGVLLEFVVLDWHLCNGNLRGPGDYGGRLRLAWRHCEKAVAHFSTPPVNPYLLPRLPMVYKMVSVLGTTKIEVPHRFTAKQKALKFKLGSKP